MLAGAVAQAPAVVQVGRVTAVYWEGDAGVATALAEFADRAGPWPGLPPQPDRPIRLLVTRSHRRFDSLTLRRVPEWGAGAAFPARRTIVVDLEGGDPLRVLRHELAHLALHEAVRRVPRWFDEGYAARAAGEWDRLDALALSWELVTGPPPSLVEVDRRLTSSGAGEAGAAYAYATTAVLELERLGGARGLAPLITALGRTADLDRALRTTYQLTLGQFEHRWHEDLRRRYGWLRLLTSFSVFWAGAALLLVALSWFRRRRNRERRRAMDAEPDAATPWGEDA